MTTPICPGCGRTMRPPEACGVDAFALADGSVLARVPLGAETADWWLGTTPHLQCHDCGVVSGQTHHVGCDMEQCPRCHEQLLGCDCELAEDA